MSKKHTPKAQLWIILLPNLFLWQDFPFHHLHHSSCSASRIRIILVSCFSHIAYSIYQYILLALSFKYIQNPTISHYFTTTTLVQAITHFTHVVLLTTQLLSLLLYLTSLKLFSEEAGWRKCRGPCSSGPLNLAK